MTRRQRTGFGLLTLLAATLTTSGSVSSSASITRPVQSGAGVVELTVTEGIQAAIYAFKRITSPYWLNEKRLRDSKVALIGEKTAQAARRPLPRR